MWMCQPKKFMFGWCAALEQGLKPIKRPRACSAPKQLAPQEYWAGYHGLEDLAQPRTGAP